MTFQSPVVRTIKALRQKISQWKADNKSVALVPTMGALHQGHLSLVELAKKKADKTVVSIFVNPAQFAPHEDLETYPREEINDQKKLSALKTNLIYAPQSDQMYREDFSTSIIVGGISEGLCGKSRPHFFGGVATVVCKLLLQVQPNIAVFGEKDYQQLLVIRRMVRDLDIPVQIVGGPIVREFDGLAMSSRNIYLNDEERELAPRLFKTLRTVAENIAAGNSIYEQITFGIDSLNKDGFKIDYLEVRDANSLNSIRASDLEGQSSLPSMRVFAAAHLGETRLIDNVAIPEENP